jgi:hypothetical protein
MAVKRYSVPHREMAAGVNSPYTVTRMVTAVNPIRVTLPVSPPAGHSVRRLYADMSEWPIAGLQPAVW